MCCAQGFTCILTHSVQQGIKMLRPQRIAGRSHSSLTQVQVSSKDESGVNSSFWRGPLLDHKIDQLTPRCRAKVSEVQGLSRERETHQA